MLVGTRPRKVAVGGSEEAVGGSEEVRNGGVAKGVATTIVVGLTTHYRRTIPSNEGRRRFVHASVVPSFFLLWFWYKGCTRQ